MINTTFTANTVAELHRDMMEVLFPGSILREQVYALLRQTPTLLNVAEQQVVDPDNVVPMTATAGGPPRRRRGKGNGAPAQAQAAPDTVEEDGDAPDIDEDTAAKQISRDSVIERLTLIFQGADAATKTKIKNWRDKLGYKLIRDLTDKDVPAALKFLNNLQASVS